MKAGMRRWMLRAGGVVRVDLGLNAVLLLASYPADVFAGATKVLLYTAIPAAFVSGERANYIFTFDARADVVALEARAGDDGEVPCAILKVVIRHDTPSVRPDDVLAGLRSRGGLQVEQTPVATRSAQGPLDQKSGMVGDPLAFDRDAS